MTSTQLFRDFAGVGDTVWLRKNVSGKTLGPRTITHINKEEVRFVLPDGRASVSTLTGLTVELVMDGLLVKDSAGRVLAEYSKKP